MSCAKKRDFTHFRWDRGILPAPMFATANRCTLATAAIPKINHADTMKWFNYHNSFMNVHSCTTVALRSDRFMN
jgi:hypothetical protein